MLISVYWLIELFNSFLLKKKFNEKPNVLSWLWNAIIPAYLAISFYLHFSTFGIWFGFFRQFLSKKKFFFWKSFTFTKIIIWSQKRKKMIEFSICHKPSQISMQPFILLLVYCVVKTVLCLKTATIWLCVVVSSRLRSHSW